MKRHQLSRIQQFSCGVLTLALLVSGCSAVSEPTGGVDGAGIGSSGVDAIGIDSFGGDPAVPTREPTQSGARGNRAQVKDPDSRDAKPLRIGIKFDQPGTGYMDNGIPTGLDVDVAAYVAMKLGYDPNEIEWVETTSAHREEYLENGTVDMVFATYSMTDEGREKVDFAGPYLVAGQDFLVRADDEEFTGPESVSGKTICAADGSNSTTQLEELYGSEVNILVTPDYSSCIQAVVDGKADAASTTDHILAGLASSPEFYGLVRLVGAPFTQEKVGVGLPNNSPGLCAAVNAALAEMVADETWEHLVFRHTFGAEYDPFAYDNPPQTDPCDQN